MNLPPMILGTTAVTKLQETASSSVLQIGSDKLTRGELAKVGCYNFLAARLLSHILNHELQVKNLAEVYDKVHPRDLALPHLGVVCLAVLGAAFEAKGIGGQTPLENYVRRHSEKKNGTVEFRTFDTIKRKALVLSRLHQPKKRRKAN